jgi:hypothetical protein
MFEAIFRIAALVKSDGQGQRVFRVTKGEAAANDAEFLSLYWLLPSLRRILLPLLHFIRDVSSSSLPCRGIALGTSVQK